MVSDKFGFFRSKNQNSKSLSNKSDLFVVLSIRFVEVSRKFCGVAEHEYHDGIGLRGTWCNGMPTPSRGFREIRHKINPHY